MEVFKKIISICFRVLLSILLLVFLFKQVDERSLFAVIKNVNKPLLLLAFIVYFFVYVLGLLRWYKLIKAVNISIPLGRLISSFCGGAFFSLFQLVLCPSDHHFMPVFNKIMDQFLQV